MNNITDKELLNILPKVIDHYNICIDSLPIKGPERELFLYCNDVDYGICNYIFFRYDRRGINNIFLKRFTNNKSYLCDTPHDENYDRAKELLQIRVDRMKEFLIILQNENN